MEAKAQPIEDKARELQAKLAPQLEEARAKLSDFNERTKAFIRERPGTCLLGAVAAGYLIGRLASRRW
jgi:ElaB/YqjD/DUF883 family membrane-anchored ribosome-binding protein